MKRGKSLIERIEEALEIEDVREIIDLEHR